MVYRIQHRRNPTNLPNSKARGYFSFTFIGHNYRSTLHAISFKEALLFVRQLAHDGTYVKAYEVLENGKFTLCINYVDLAEDCNAVPGPICIMKDII